MISGASQMDAAILVVAGTDGQMPQTREHLLMAKQTGVKRIIVFVNKADLVDLDVLQLVEIEIRELLEVYGYNADETPVIYGSAKLALAEDTSEYGEPSIQRLMDTLDSYIPDPVRDTISPLLMPIDNFFPVKNVGTIIVGTIERGTLKKKTHLELIGFGECFKAIVNDIEIFQKSVPQVSMNFIDRLQLVCFKCLLVVLRPRQVIMLVSKFVVLKLVN